MKTNEQSITIRFPKEMHKQLKKDAQRESRSFNKQVIHTLKVGRVCIVDKLKEK